MRRRPLKPMLKWAGGKRWLVPELVQLYRGHEARVYQELFSGGLAAALALCPKVAVLSDINRWLINYYVFVRSGLSPREDLGNNRNDYNRARDEFNQLTVEGRFNTREGAQLFGYLNRTCFNGLCRFNRSGGFNVPFGKFKSIDYSTDYSEHREAMRSWHFTVSDFRSAGLFSGAFVYCDPPYPDTFDSYSGTTFTWADQGDLADLLAVHDGPVVVSNSADTKVLDLYRARGFEVRTVEARRSISASGASRKKVLEMLATRNI